MASNSELKSVEEFIIKGPNEYLNTAEIIHESWPIVRNTICRKFLDILRKMIEQYFSAHESITYQDIRDNNYNLGFGVGMRSKKWNRHICIYMAPDSGNNKSCLEDIRKLSQWSVGVYIKSGEFIEEDRKSLINNIRNLVKGGKNCFNYIGKDYYIGEEKWKDYPYYHYAGNRERDWYSIIPELGKEVKEEGGGISKHYERNFVEVAENFIPIIDKFENVKSI